MAQPTTGQGIVLLFNLFKIIIIDIGVLRQSAVQYLVSSFDRCEICEAELILG